MTEIIKTKQTTPWTDERIALLRKLVGEGLSSALIGRELGCSRNSIIGKAHRLGLSLTRPETPEQLGAPGPHHERAARIVQRKAQIQRSDDLVCAVHVVGNNAAHVAGNKTIYQLGYGDCRFPLGDAKTPAELFCGAHALPGKSYCEEHCIVTGVAVRRSKA